MPAAYINIHKKARQLKHQALVWAYQCFFDLSGL